MIEIVVTCSASQIGNSPRWWTQMRVLVDGLTNEPTNWSNGLIVSYPTNASIKSCSSLPIKSSSTSSLKKVRVASIHRFSSRNFFRFAIKFLFFGFGLWHENVMFSVRNCVWFQCLINCPDLESCLPLGFPAKRPWLFPCMANRTFIMKSAPSEACTSSTSRHIVSRPMQKLSCGWIDFSENRIHVFVPLLLGSF